MKFLHTADWHIGKILHKKDLYEDMCLFFDWLENYIIEEHIDVLLVSGDVFDLANPSNRDITLYFNVLRRLSLIGIKTIITGGNHDSVSLLNAPSGLLKEMNITVIGGVPDEFDQQLVPIYSKDGKLNAVVLAVPFLRDRDLRLSVSADVAVEKAKIIPLAIKNHYDRLISIARSLYDDVPLIGMGHFFMQGSMISDSEREIHVGNLMGLDRNIVSSEIAYMALGHIHKPQRIDKLEHIRYSGSPIYLDFSEIGYDKLVVTVDVEQGKPIEITPVKLPKFRNLVRLKGSLSEVKDRLMHYQDDLKLPAWVELDICEDTTSPTLMYEKETLESGVLNSKCHVINCKLTTRSNTENNIDIMQVQNIANLSPQDIFDIRLEAENLDDSLKQDLKIVYQHILESFAN